MNWSNDPALHVSCGACVCALLRFAPLTDRKYSGSDTQRTECKTSAGLATSPPLLRQSWYEREAFGSGAGCAA